MSFLFFLFSVIISSEVIGLLKCASFFAGVGGIDLGFHQSKFFSTVYANEINESSVMTYEANFPVRVDCRDIALVQPKDIPDFDVMLAGFPCQAFSIAGLREGFQDSKGRGALFFELIRILKDKNPSVVFLENVKNLAGHDDGKTLSVILRELEGLGYFVKYRVLNATEYGNIPQNRERIYIVGFKDEQVCDRFVFPDPIPLRKRVDEVIDFETKMPEKYYYRQGKYKGDIFEKLTEAADDDRAVYQWRRKYVRKNKSGVIPTLTANQGEGGHNVCIVKTAHGFRKMIPRECFNAQGFPKTFKLPVLNDSVLYKQAGNSVCVSVVFRIAKEIQRALLG